jgi:hypothetical protein
MCVRPVTYAVTIILMKCEFTVSMCKAKTYYFVKTIKDIIQDVVTIYVELRFQIT